MGYESDHKHDALYREITAKGGNLQRREYHRVVKQLVQQEVRNWIADDWHRSSEKSKSRDAVTASVLLTKPRKRFLRLEIARITGLPSGDESEAQRRWLELHEQRIYQYTRNLLYYSRNQERLKSKSRAAKDAARERLRRGALSSTPDTRSSNEQVQARATGTSRRAVAGSPSQSVCPRVAVSPSDQAHTVVSEAPSQATSENESGTRTVVTAPAQRACPMKRSTCPLPSLSFDLERVTQEHPVDGDWSLARELNQADTCIEPKFELRPARVACDASSAMAGWASPWSTKFSGNQTGADTETLCGWLSRSRPGVAASAAFADEQTSPCWRQASPEHLTQNPATQAPTLEVLKETEVSLEYDLHVESVEEASGWSSAGWTQFVHEWTGSVQPSDEPPNWQRIQTAFRKRDPSAESLPTQREDSETSALSADMSDLNLVSATGLRRSDSLESAVDGYFSSTESDPISTEAALLSDGSRRRAHISCRTQARQRMEELVRQGRLSGSGRPLVPTTPLREGVI